MDRSPKGREIESVEGNPGDIIMRGRQITRLGAKMLSCATTLETIKNEAVGDGSQQGKAIEKLKESIGDSYEKLREAGELYKPVGPVITAYGTALDGAKPIIDNSADDCVDKWATYQSLPGDREGSTTPEAGGGILGLGGYDADSPEAKEKAENNAAKAAAYQDWLESAQAFDGGYDTWEEAFETAVDDISDELSGSIKDSRWDNISGFINVVTTILSWAALVVGVIALFAGGWIIALIALGLGALVLALTALQYANGDKTLRDVVFAALAILPVGKLSHLTKLVQFPRMAKLLGARSSASRVWGALSKGPISTFLTAKASGKAFEVLSRAKMAEKIFGPTMKTIRGNSYKMYFNGGLNAARANLPLMRVVFKAEWGLSKLSTAAGHYGRVATALSNSGGANIKLPPWVGVFV